MIRKQEITTFEFPEDAIIWDVRDSSAYAEAHVKGAINQPITELSAQSLTQVSTDQPIYILCGGGSKAPRAAELLEGFDRKIAATDRPKTAPAQGHVSALRVREDETPWTSARMSFSTSCMCRPTVGSCST